MIDAAGVALAIVIVTVAIPMLIRANGTRPFIVGYVGWAFIVVAAVFTPQDDYGWLRAYYRLIAELLILSTMAWSIWEHRGR